MRLTSSIPVVPKTVSLYFRKGDAENLTPYMVTFRKRLLFPEAVIFYTQMYLKSTKMFVNR